MKKILQASSILFAFVIGECHAQNLEEISLKKGPKLTGSLNVNTVGYKAFGLPQRRDPFNWFVTGGLNLNLFGYSAPFTFSVSNVPDLHPAIGGGPYLL